MEFAKWFTPELRALMEENVSMFASGYRANVNETQASDADSSSAVEAALSPESAKRHERINLILGNLCDIDLDGDGAFVTEDERDGLILGLVRQIKDVERQVKERKEWAQAKAMQAAKKLNQDLNELRMLRMEREKIWGMMQWKLTPDDPTRKRLAEMDCALREGSIRADRVTAAFRRLETENAEMMAEIEGSKLSASESMSICLMVATRASKYVKKLSAWDKQRAKLHRDIATEKQRIVELEEELRQVAEANKSVEAKWREVQNARECALGQVEEEGRLKEATEANTRRKQEALRSKFELDMMRQKDELQRLEDELARLTSQDESEIINRLFRELHISDDHDRQCVVCVEDEASVVFLPCGHQIVCGRCNEAYGEATCPVCRHNIDERVRVFGVI